MSGPNLSRIGKYEITGVLGRGGMGLVYRAFDKYLAREVAIKTLTEGFAGDVEMLERLHTEASKTAMLKHPNIVTIYDLGEQDGFPYIVMEYVVGEALDRVIQSERTLPLLTKLKIIQQVCQALGYAHCNEVIHRDVKPANVILQPDGVVKLLDFGIAQRDKDRSLTRTGSVIGTLAYMAPERLRNRPFDGRSDIFSTGVMLYQLVTGSLPFVGEECAVMHQLLNEGHPPLENYVSGYPKDLDAIVAKSMAKEPEDRYASAEEMAGEIDLLVEELKREQTAEMFQQAEQFVRDEEFTKAREILLRVAKLDSQHVGARQLMVQVQQNIAQRQKAAQVQQLLLQAQDARREKRFDEAISSLENALKLDPSNPDVGETLERVRHLKARNEQIERYLRQVDGARSKGDIGGAQAAMAKALEIDKDDSRVRAAYAALVQQAEEALRSAKVKKLLDSARTEMAARHFTAAIKLLTEIEEVDPSNPELWPLLEAAKTGKDQETRRRVVEQLQGEIAIAVTTEEVKRALVMVNDALARMPNEPTLLQFKGQLDRQIREHEQRRWVDETVRKCRALLDKSPSEALQLARESLRQCPGNERLQLLKSGLEEHLGRVQTEQVRAQYLNQANRAMDQRNYREAVRLLEACQAEGAFSEEMAGLLDFARHEAQREQRVLLADATLNEAQALIAKDAYAEAIQLLEPVVKETEDLTLHNLLEKARNQHQVQRQRTDAISDALSGYLREEQFDEGITFLRAQPETVLRQPAAQEALKSLRAARERDRLALQAVASAYAALDNTVQSSALREGFQEHKESSFVPHVAKAFAERRTVCADRMLSSAMNQARTALSAGNTQLAQEALDSVATMAEFGRPEVQAVWQQLRKETSKSNILARIGLKGPRAG